MVDPNQLAIRADSLSKRFGKVKALDAVSFELPRGAFLSVFGSNGAGKTTLLRLLATLERPSTGTATVLGYDLRQEAEALRGRIGVISHRSMLYPDMTAHENLMFFARLYGVAEPAARVGELLESVELSSRSHDPVRTFSRGMTQRLAIARALVNDPELMLLDEPYAGLDLRAMSIFDGMIDRIRPGRSFLMVSHDLELGFRRASHVMVLSAGRLVMFADKDEFDLTGFAGFVESVQGGGI